MFKITFSQIRLASLAALWETFALRNHWPGAGINLEQADAFVSPGRRLLHKRELPLLLEPQAAV